MADVNKKKSSWLIWILIILSLLLVVLCVVIWRIFKLPLGPGLDPSPTFTTVSTAEVTDTPFPLAPTPTKVEVCGESSVWNVLVLGSDAADLYYPQGADLTRIVRVDFLNRQVSVFAFSRDLWVDAGELGFTNPAINATKLGLIYHEARLRSLETDPNEVKLAGVNAIAKTITRNFEVEIDHYIAIDLEQFPAMIDAIGGLPINIPANLTEHITKMEFKAGQQTLTGEQAAVYARALQVSDFERIQRNNLVLEALRQRLLDPAVWINLPQLILEFNDAAITDFSPEQASHLVCLMNEIPKESIVQDGVRAEWTSPYREDGLLWDRTAVLNRLRELEMVH